MRFARFIAQGKEHIGVLTADSLRIVSLDSFSFDDMNCLIAAFTPKIQEEIASLIRDKTIKSWPMKEVRLLSPIARPIHDILCVGVNYRAHLEECASAMQMTAPPKAVYFSKRACELIGPEDAIESHHDMDSCLDYEVELAVILSKGGRDIPPEKVEEYIFGYSIFNDISARTLQKNHLQWFRGKSLDTFSALGPLIVHKSEIPFPPELDLHSRVNGEIRQSSNTGLYLRDIKTLVSELSQGCTLEAGDIIATGTPSGVGMGYNPPRYMKPGDLVECEIQHIGILRNIVR